MRWTTPKLCWDMHQQSKDVWHTVEFSDVLMIVTKKLKAKKVESENIRKNGIFE